MQFRYIYVGVRLLCALYVNTMPFCIVGHPNVLNMSMSDGRKQQSGHHYFHIFFYKQVNCNSSVKSSIWLIEDLT